MAESNVPYRSLRDLLDGGPSRIGIIAQASGHKDIISASAKKEEPKKEPPKKPINTIGTDIPDRGRIMELVHDGRRVTILAATDKSKSGEERFEVVDNRGTKMIASARQLRRINS